MKLTATDLEALGELLGRLTKAEIAKAVQPLQAQIMELQGRQLKYVGTFRDGTKYSPGEMVTDHGSLWHCDSPTLLRPGHTDSWQLVAKRGANGKDAR